MNATRWVTLSEFVKHLGREGIVHVEDNEQGWFISWIDNSPQALKRQAALQKMERAKMDDEGRERKRLKEQISNAQKQQQDDVASSDDRAQVGLQRDASSAPIRLGIGTSTSATEAKPAESPAATSQASTPKPSISFSTSSSTSAAQKPMAFSNPLKKAPSSNPLKSGNPLKSSSSKPSTSQHQQQPRTMAEKIRLEEEERKRQQSDKRRFNGPMPANNGGIKRIRM